MPQLSAPRQILNSLWPEGKFWTPADGDDYDLLLDGISDNCGAVKDDLSQLAYLRDPMRTPILSDLEKEYAVIPAAESTESERREYLSSVKYNRSTLGAYDTLQEKLRAAGFENVYVHVNSPAVDPAIFLERAFNMTCGDLLPGGNAAECGEAEAICAAIGGELVVNGDLYSQEPNYVNLCDESVNAGDTVYCGDFDGYKSQDDAASYVIPTEAGYWPLIFFVGGEATRDVNGYLTEIEFYSVPAQRRVEFRRLILKYKPLFSWGGLIVIYD
ncbi:MAG: hypothetical protein ACRCUT_04580 [Spirochaetota bacterium]